MRNRYLWLAMALCLSIIVLINVIGPVREALSLYVVSRADMAIILAGAAMSFVIIRLIKRFRITA
jgi:hypothetical protein